MLIFLFIKATDLKNISFILVIHRPKSKIYSLLVNVYSIKMTSKPLKKTELKNIVIILVLKRLKSKMYSRVVYVFTIRKT